MPSADRQNNGAIDSHGPEWRDWVYTNVGAGCDPDEMARRMVASGWTPASAREAIAFATAGQEGDGKAVARPQLPAIGRWEFDGHGVTVTMRLEAPAVALCENALSGEECAQLLAYAEHRGLQPSTVVDNDDGRTRPHPERTSTGLMLSRAETELVARIEHRLARLTAWPVENGEGLQILRYGKGQEYRPHFDAFPDGMAARVHCEHGGQRVNTVVVYLQSPERGGGTYFPNLGLTVRPQAGTAVIFHNVDAAGLRANETLHSGQPVEAGEKIILTYWQREQAFG
ncbi:MAG: 2OG-Fe(II) oxygenase [Novosphingobium sp.]|jgi:prolyl 4-hydroxylase|nr:2OG-Fe(II) oxygenase [Novosphingobium sp.]